MSLADYDIVVGLEVHVQLGTRTKMFCGCEVTFADEPNTHVCPVCLGLPGALPVVNDQALNLAIRAGVAVDATINRECWFDRKNYFYADLPKGYQITQFERPIVVDGTLEGVGIIRAHLEEDTAKNTHAAASTRVDCNRAGVPLLEIVSAPAIDSPELAERYVRSLQRRLQYAGVSGCNMERGEMRCDVNVSLKPKGSAELGTRTEVKNLNSARNVRDAVAFEAWRQACVLDAGGRVVQETRGWRNELTEYVPDLEELSPGCLDDVDPSALDDVDDIDPPDDILDLSGYTVPQRRKEEAHDYRYFPEPDLPRLQLTQDRITRETAAAGERPEARLERYLELGLSDYAARTLVLDSDRDLADAFDAICAAGATPSTAANLVLNQMLATINARDDIREVADYPLTAGQLAAVAALIDAGRLGNEPLRSLHDALLAAGPDADPAALGAERKLLTEDVAEDELLVPVRQAIAAHADAVEDVRAGNRKAIGAIMGDVMRATDRRFNPAQIRALIEREIQRDATRDTDS